MCALVLIVGFGINVFNSFDDYGLRSGKLNENIIAQSTNTSGSSSSGNDTSGSSTSGDDQYIMHSTYMCRSIVQVIATADKDGILTVFNLKLVGYKKYTTYTVMAVSYSCRPCADSRYTCDTRKQRMEFLTISEEGCSTSGN